MVAELSVARLLVPTLVVMVIRTRRFSQRLSKCGNGVVVSQAIQQPWSISKCSLCFGVALFERQSNGDPRTPAFLAVAFYRAAVGIDDPL